MRLRMAEGTPTKEREEMTAEGFATIPESAQFLRVSRAKLYDLMQKGEIRYAKVGKCRRIPWRVLREYAASCLIGS
jgi:excisionase family DNA binding protein